MNDFEEFVRQNFDEINELTITNTADCYNYDFLHLFKHCSKQQEIEIKEILKEVKIKLQRIQEIKDECYNICVNQ
jgi:hypothetical protein